MNQPTPDNVVLGLLAAHKSHGYRLLEYFRDPDELGRIWNMSTSQLYAVLKRLEQQNFVTGQAVTSEDAPPRIEYHLTEAGRANLLIWLNDKQPTASIRQVRVEFLSRLYVARLLKLPTLPIVRAQAKVCRLQRKLLLAQREEAGSGIGLLALDLMIAQLDAILQWIDGCEPLPPLSEEE